MSRVKRGTTTHARHKKLLKSAKGYVGSKSKLYRVASEQKLHSLSYAYRDRRTKKRDFRQLWIVRLNAAARKNGMTYSQLIKQLSTHSIKINRKILALVAWHYPETFTSIVQKVNK